MAGSCSLTGHAGSHNHSSGKLSWELYIKYLKDDKKQSMLSETKGPGFTCVKLVGTIFSEVLIYLLFTTKSKLAY